VQASRFERLPMRRTTVFIVELIQHTIVAMCRALSAIPESGVVAARDRRVEQRCVQHVLGQAQQTTKAHEVDDLAHWSHAYRRVNIGVYQLNEEIGSECVCTAELPQNRDQ
jgi:hypothetical protein